jgi:hypothetical protein
MGAESTEGLFRKYIFQVRGVSVKCWIAIQTRGLRAYVLIEIKIAIYLLQ